MRLLCFSVQSLRRTSVHGDEPELPRTHVQKKKPRDRTVRQNALQRVLSRLFLRVGCSLFYIAAFCHIGGSFLVLFLGDAERIPGVSGKEEVSTGAETDGQLRGGSHCCYQEPGTFGWGPQRDVPEAVHSRGRSRELLERAFDDGNSCARMRNLLVLFQVGSKLLPCFFLLQISPDRPRCQCDSCHWASNGVLVSLRLRGGEGSVAVSLDEQLLIFRLLGFSSMVSVHIFRFSVGRAE